MLREIVMDTETTGLDPANGDRLIELGCIEIVNRIPTGREFHRYPQERRDGERAPVRHHLSTGLRPDRPRSSATPPGDQGEEQTEQTVVEPDIHAE